MMMMTAAFQSQVRSGIMLHYNVDIAKGVCSCFIGSSEHCANTLSAVIFKVDSSIAVSSGLKVANKESHALMFEVVTGKKPEAGWLSPLKKFQQASSVADDDAVNRQHDSSSVGHPECSWISATDDSQAMLGVAV